MYFEYGSKRDESGLDFYFTRLEIPKFSCNFVFKIFDDMNSCDLLFQSFTAINWLWFAVAAIVSFAVGGVWYSLLFAKAWIKVFKVEMGKVTTGSFLRTMLLQFAANLLFGLVFFVLTKLSLWIALLSLVGFCGWEKGNLNFEFSRMKDFIMAVTIRVGYTFVAGIIFILFALI